MVIDTKSPPAVPKEERSLHPHPLYNTRLPLAIINVLPQPRKTFLDIPILGDDIAGKNLYNLLLISRYDTNHCQKYIDLINDLWDEAKFHIEDLAYVIEENEKIFYVLVDGERRFRSCIYLRDVGCESCREKFGPGGCYKRHFGDLSVEARVGVNIDADEVIDRQASANTHHRVPPYEEATFYDRLFRRRKLQNPKYSLNQFAKRMGRSPETIRQAIRFCELPLEYQERVKKGQIPWGIGLEITRLQSEGVSEKELEWWVLRAITGNYKVPEFRELVNNFLQILRSDQTSLFDIFSEVQKKELEKPHFRLVVERHTIIAIWSWIHYFTRVLDLFESGKLGKEDSPFSTRSPVKVFRTLIEKEKQLLPHLEGLLPKERYEEARETIQKAELVLVELEAVLPT